MGLDAAVYSDDECDSEIASAWLGNVDSVARVRAVLKEKCPDAVVMLTKVVYSGTHSGDSLTPEEIGRVRAELKEIEASCGTEIPVREFLTDFGPLVELAVEHGRPITFV